MGYGVRELGLHLTPNPSPEPSSGYPNVGLTLTLALICSLLFHHVPFQYSIVPLQYMFTRRVSLLQYMLTRA